MSESTRVIVILVLGMIILLVLALYFQTILMKQALRSVIKTFRDHQALTPETAKLQADIGLKRRSLFQIRGFRDYKPTAIQFLEKQNIIQFTEDGRLYLVEEILLQSGIETRIGRKK